MAATTYSKILYAGTYANYQAIATKDANVLYFCTDNGKLFKGEIDFTDSFVASLESAVPTAANAVPGKIYYATDTKKFRTLIDGALVEIGNPIDAQGSQTTSTITNVSTDDHVPSAKNVWTYGQEILAQATGGSAVVKTIANDVTTDAGIIVTYGDDSTSSVVPTGIVTAVEKDTANEASIIVKNSAGAADTNITLKGVVTTPSWDSTNLKLTLPVSDGTAVEVNIPKDIFLKSGSYDATNRQIVLVLNDSSSTEIRFNVADMVDIYIAKDTTTVDTTVAWNTTAGKYEISSDVNVSADANNKLTIANDGLLVDISDLEGSHNNLATAALEWGTF